MNLLPNGFNLIIENHEIIAVETKTRRDTHALSTISESINNKYPTIINLFGNVIKLDLDLIVDCD